jgi:hypothetical protein
MTGTPCSSACLTQPQQQQQWGVLAGSADAAAAPAAGLCGTLQHSASTPTSSDSAGDAFPGITCSLQPHQQQQQQQFAGTCVQPLLCADINGIQPNSFVSAGGSMGLPNMPAVPASGQVSV